MRGKAEFHNVGVFPAGITPAHAGKRGGPIEQPERNGDHPRTCGEKVVSSETEWKEQGSPPHMRGKDSESLERQALIFSSAHFPFNF